MTKGPSSTAKRTGAAAGGTSSAATPDGPVAGAPSAGRSNPPGVGATLDLSPNAGSAGLGFPIGRSTALALSAGRAGAASGAGTGSRAGGGVAGAGEIGAAGTDAGAGGGASGFFRRSVRGEGASPSQLENRQPTTAPMITPARTTIRMMSSVRRLAVGRTAVRWLALVEIPGWAAGEGAVWDPPASDAGPPGTSSPPPPRKSRLKNPATRCTRSLWASTTVSSP